MGRKRKCGFVLPALLLALALGLGGCASMDSSRDVGHYVVSVPQTPIFRYGPAQSFGPDFNLRQGQHVIMLRRDFGYSRIMTDDGQSGYVATEDLAPAPPPKAAPTPAPGRRLPTRGNPRPGVSSANNRVIETTGPLFGEEVLPPLPESEAEANPPKPPEKPEFRYPKPKPGFRVNVPRADGTKP